MGSEQLFFNKSTSQIVSHKQQHSGYDVHVEVDQSFQRQQQQGQNVNQGCTRDAFVGLSL